MTLTRLSLANPVAVVVACILIVIFGALSLTRLPIQMTPEITRMERVAGVSRVGSFGVREHEVRIGVGQGDDIEVLGEVAPGDRVVIRGNERLQQGQAVDIMDS